MPQITLYDLSTSRSIRTAWLLEELEVPYHLIHADRNESGLSNDDFKKETGTLQGKAPVLKDGDLVIQESGAIAEYLCEMYDRDHRLIPAFNQPKARNKVREFIHAAEGTLMIHCLPYLYARRIDAEAAGPLKPKLPVLVKKDLDWLESELDAKGGGWLVGQEVTAADTMMVFSVQFIFLNKLAGEDIDQTNWGRISEWLGLLERHEPYQRAVQKTRFVLKPQV